ncbi:NADPH-dependent 1-acyldihydroxyacetone phosphate reductase [Cytospora mali]|uniref:NADPH-dependent 1-acyldihydroxyacetone phosphate reductase n=1 Tax=Cytospora mali TaxID=578113 RepID=A0A194V716_CYTMA|nr:NADPH-dependent 1-acyldihydroxyacetone phosphate reductase [Valsa mali var. pyri (nom. inval.)]
MNSARPFRPKVCQAFTFYTESASGLHVIATARNLSVLSDLADKPGFTCLELDVTKQSSIDVCKGEVVKLTGGKLDILINNAGRTHTVPATDLDIDDVRVTFEANVFGVMAMVKSFVHLLIPSKGLIINVSSAASMTPYVFASAYCATKGAVNSYSRTLRQELRPFGVRVMVAEPGMVKTNINLKTDRMLLEGSLYTPIADVYKWRLLFSKDASGSITAERYAKKLAADALKPEWPLFLRGIFNMFGLCRPDWHYYGGLAREVWFGSCIGEWLMDTVMYRMFKLGTLEVALKKQEAEARKLK